MRTILNVVSAGTAVWATTGTVAVLALVVPGSAAVAQPTEEPGAAGEGVPPVTVGPGQEVAAEDPVVRRGRLQGQSRRGQRDDLEELLATPPEGEIFTYKDGEYTRKVYLQKDFVVARSGSVFSRPQGAAGGDAVGGDIVGVASASGTDGLPVFRSSAGGVMTLPGGVLVIFESTQTAEHIDAFFAARNIAADRLSPLGEIPNGFVVATDPGFPSLELATDLADEPELKLAAPNWKRYYETR